MFDQRWRSIIKRHGIPLGTLLVSAGSLAFFILRLAQNRGLYPGVIGFFQDADRLLQTHSVGSAFYPPLVIWLVALLKGLHVPVHPAIFNGGWLLLGTVMLYVLIYAITHRRIWAWLGSFFVLLNPYFIWTIMLSNDTGPEWVWLLCVIVAIYLAIEGRHLSCSRGLMILGAGASVLTRITGLYIIIAILITSWMMERIRLRSLIYVGALSLLLAVLVLVGWNKAQVGTFTLSTNAGMNVYFGNHPNYLHGHPHYDIDGFLGEAAQRDVDPALSEPEKDEAFQAQGWRFIYQDPAAFVYRIGVKSVWYWVGIEKIPNYSSAVNLDIKTQTIHLTRLDVRQGLAYMFYRLVCLAAVGFWLLHGRFQTRLPAWLVWAGWVGLWPIVALTFPDTRFRLSLETLVSVWVVCALYEFWKRRQDLLQSSL